MKNKKGFTLIELLAIIVILAIIAVITVPIILNIIENSKKGAATDSAYGYKEAVEKYYASRLSQNSDFILDGEYSINDNGTISDGENSYDILISGTAPSSGYINMDKGSVVNGCMQINEYAVTIQDKKVVSTLKGNCSSVPGESEEPEEFVPDSVSFSTDSWSVIKSNLVSNRNYYALGSSKEVVIDGNSYTVRIANISNEGCDVTGFSQSACGVVIEFADVIIDTNISMKWQNSNAGGWPTTNMRVYLNDDDDTNSTISLYEKLPSDLRSIIIDTYLVSGHGNQSGAVNYTSTDKIYFFSASEVLGYNSSDDTVKISSGNVVGETRRLDYYRTSGSTVAKKRLDGYDQAWWLRSAYSGSDQIYLVMRPDALIGQSFAWENSDGIAPAFRILE